MFTELGKILLDSLNGLVTRGKKEEGCQFYFILTIFSQMSFKWVIAKNFDPDKNFHLLGLSYSLGALRRRKHAKKSIWRFQ